MGVILLLTWRSTALKEHIIELHAHSYHYENLPVGTSRCSLLEFEGSGKTTPVKGRFYRKVGEGPVLGCPLQARENANMCFRSFPQNQCKSLLMQKPCFPLSSKDSPGFASGKLPRTEAKRLPNSPERKSSSGLRNDGFTRFLAPCLELCSSQTLQRRQMGASGYVRALSEGDWGGVTEMMWRANKSKALESCLRKLLNFSTASVSSEIIHILWVFFFFF